MGMSVSKVQLMNCALEENGQIIAYFTRSRYGNPYIIDGYALSVEVNWDHVAKHLSQYQDYTEVAYLIGYDLVGHINGKILSSCQEGAQLLGCKKCVYKQVADMVYGYYESNRHRYASYCPCDILLNPSALKPDEALSIYGDL